MRDLLLCERDPVFERINESPAKTSRTGGKFYQIALFTLLDIYICTTKDRRQYGSSSSARSAYGCRLCNRSHIYSHTISELIHRSIGIQEAEHVDMGEFSNASSIDWTLQSWLCYLPGYFSPIGQGPRSDTICDISASLPLSPCSRRLDHCSQRFPRLLWPGC